LNIFALGAEKNGQGEKIFRFERCLGRWIFIGQRLSAEIQKFNRFVLVAQKAFHNEFNTNLNWK